MQFQCEGTALAGWLTVKVFPGDWGIDVEASHKWIVIEWEPLETSRESTEAKPDRSTRTPSKRRCTRYQWTIRATKDAMKSIIEEIPVLYYERHELNCRWCKPPMDQSRFKFLLLRIIREEENSAKDQRAIGAIIALIDNLSK
jgi:hypothetical protein